MKRHEEIDVDFEVECDDFEVPDWPGLRCSATFRVTGTVEIDRSGDEVTPDGNPDPRVMLMDPIAYEVCVCDEIIDVPLPGWLQQRLVHEDAEEFDSAFLEAIGGRGVLDQLAIEKADA